MAGLKPPGHLSLQGNVSKSWKEWIWAYKLYALVAELKKKSEDIQCATFLHVAGPAAQEMHAMTFSSEDQDVMGPLIEKSQAFCEPRKNVTVSRYRFNSRAHRKGENVDSFLTDLRSSAEDCEYDKLEESLITDRIIVCVVSWTMRSVKSCFKWTSSRWRNVSSFAK